MDGRNWRTCFFRLILAIPHLILVGGPGFIGIAGNGALGLVAVVGPVISWFAIVFTGKQPKGLWDLTSFYLRWRSKAVAYAALLRDEYPPFGDGEYAVDFGVAEFPEQHDRWSVALRIFFLIQHAIVLFFIGIAWGSPPLSAGWRSCSRGLTGQPVSLCRELSALVAAGRGVRPADARRVPAVQP